MDVLDSPSSLPLPLSVGLDPESCFLHAWIAPGSISTWPNSLKTISPCLQVWNQDPARCPDNACRNRLLAGLMLHVTRKQPGVRGCRGRGTTLEGMHGCSQARDAEAGNRQGNAQRMHGCAVGWEWASKISPLPMHRLRCLVPPRPSPIWCPAAPRVQGRATTPAY